MLRRFQRFSILSTFCSKKDSFHSSEVILKTILQHSDADPQNESLSDAINKNIKANKVISEEGKVKALSMFNPQQGFKLNKHLIQNSSRFVKSRNSKSLYAINLNNPMLKKVTRQLMMVKEEQILLKQLNPTSYYIGTPGTAKSCSFFNWATISNLRVPYLISNPTVEKFMQSKFKHFYFIARYNKKQIVEYILQEIQKDFGTEIAQKLRAKTEIKQVKDFMDQIKFGECIRILYQPYRNLKITPFCIIDQFNYLYTRQGREDKNVKWHNWRKVAEASEKPYILVASKNNQIIKNNDPVLALAGSKQDVEQIFLDLSSIKQKVKAFMSSLCFQLQKKGFTQIDQVIRKIQSNVPLASPLSVRIIIQSLYSQLANPNARQVVLAIENYNINEDVERFTQNIKASLQSLAHQKSFIDKINNWKNSNKLKNYENKDNQTENIGIAGRDQAQVFRLYEFLQFYENKNAMIVQTEFCYKENRYNLFSQILYVIKNKKSSIEMNYFFQSNALKLLNENNLMVYSLLNQQQIDHVFSYIDSNLQKFLTQKQINKIKQIKDMRQKGIKFQKLFKNTFNSFAEGKKQIIIQLLLRYSLLQQKTAKIQYFKYLLHLNIKKYFKFPLINSNKNWKRQYFQKPNDYFQIQKQKEQNNQILQGALNHRYNWNQFITNIAQGQSYFSTQHNNRAFDFLFSKLQQNSQLNLYFVDTTYSKNTDNLNKKFQKFTNLFSNSNMKLLLQQLSKKEQIKKIHLQYIILNYNEQCITNKSKKLYEILHFSSKENMGQKFPSFEKYGPVILSCMHYGNGFKIFQDKNSMVTQERTKFTV